MKIHRLSLENYRRFVKADWMPADGVTALIGRNGSGKSTLLEAIAFALYGTPAARTAKALLRHADAAPTDPVRVVLEIEVGGQALRIMRELRGQHLTPHATLSVDDKVLVTPGGNSNAAATEEVERLLRMDRHGFITTIVARQKELARLADLPAADRKQLILRMLGIDALDRAIQAARDRRRASHDRLEGMRQAAPQREGMRQAVKDAEVDAQQARDAASKAAAQQQQVRDAVARLEARSETLEKQQSAHEKARTACVEGRRRLEQGETELARLEAALDAARSAQARVVALADAPNRRREAEDAMAQAKDAARQAEQRRKAARRLEAARARLDRLPEASMPDLDATRRRSEEATVTHEEAQRALAVAKEACQRLRERAVRLRREDADAPCPVCDRPLGGHRDALLERWDQEAMVLDRQLKAAQAAARKAETARDAAVAAVQASDREAEAARAALRERERSEAEWAQASAELEALPAAVPMDMETLESSLEAARSDELELARQQVTAEQAAAHEQAVAQARQQRDGARQELDVLQSRLDALPDNAGAWEQARKELAEARKAETDATQAATRATTQAELAAKEVDHARQRLADAQEHWKRIRTEEKEVRYWTALSGGRGQGLLERFRSHLVGKIRPAINAEASRLLAAFTQGRYTEMLLDEDYGLFVVDDGTPYTLERFSGGETDLVHLALRLAVSRLLTQRAGAPELRFLALDEVFGSLDVHRRDAVLAALHGLGTIYSQVLLVTHQEAMRDALDAVVEVRQEGVESVLVAHQG